LERWGTFAQMTGGAAGALTGLLFVAVSIRIDVIAGSPRLRSLAAQTLALFVTVLILAVLISIPGQETWLLGVEVVVLALATGAGLFILGRQAREGATGHSIAEVVLPTTTTSVLLLAAGLVLLLGDSAGIYVLVPAVIVALTGGVIGAWLFLIKLTG